MKLTPDLFERRFDDLLEIGRAKLPSAAPAWTDYNVHDPGITLMELLAWVAEAQLYSLSRMRRDERAAYAALFGIAPRGPQPAQGLIWPDRTDPGGASATLRRSVVIGDDAAICTTQSADPTYRPTRKLLWVAGAINSLATLAADGTRVDHTATSARGDVPWWPFGASAGPRDTLRLDFACSEDSGLFPPHRSDADGAYLCVGVRADATDQPPVPARGDDPTMTRSTLEVVLEADGERYVLPVIDDTQGFLRSGVIALDVSALPASPRRFALAFQAPAGFARAPRLLRLDVNVVPIRQGRRVEREVHVVTGLPDEMLELEAQQLRFGADVPGLDVEVVEPGGIRRWYARERLDACAPSDRVFALDAARGRLTFGNGVNGRLPPAGAQVLVGYAVCDGVRGNAARNQRWRARGASDVIGVNLDPISGGSDADDDDGRRREARRRLREARPLVTACDIEAAARALPLLEVARAFVLPPDPGAPHAGTTTLIALRARPDGDHPPEVPETPRWLADIERRLDARMPLGTRLRVRPPRYVAFRIDATLEAATGADPEAVRDAVLAALRARLALVETEAVRASPATTRRTTAGAPMQTIPPRKLGQGVSLRDLAAWLRGVSAMRRVAELRVTLPSDARVTREIVVPRDGLPRIDLDASSIVVVRPGARGAGTGGVQ